LNASFLTMRLHLVRHPKPLVASGVCYGASDVACADVELQTAAVALHSELPKGPKILCSPLQRCERLAQVLLGLEADLAYKTDARLMEMNFGVWEMQAWDAIAPEQLQAWTQDFPAYRCGGSGESAGQLVRRVAQRLLQSAQAGQDEVGQDEVAQDEIWITHAGVIRALQWLSSQPFETFMALAQQRPAPLSQLRAADWPQGVVPFGQVQAWDWPLGWPLDW
jgi:alpha-ribazole phosphatase